MTWISVKDRLPNDDPDYDLDDVLILYTRICKRCLHSANKKLMAVGYFLDGWNLTQPLEMDCFPIGYQNEIEITHWMPLPKPPE